ncbi:MAG: phosphoglycerate kinase, partial [Candidatus Mariimomonas ferrooxydans]
MVEVVWRSRDKQTERIKCNPDNYVEPVVEYLRNKLNTDLYVPKFNIDEEHGIAGIGDSLNGAIEKLKRRSIGGIYLPNTRWFRGEEGEGFFRDSFAVQLAGLADVYINDAFGSWQPHVSTYDITKYIPSYAGFLMQHEIENLNRVINPERPFVAVVAGAKFDTKIGPLYAMYDKADSLILGGIIYNTYLCAKYGVSIKGVSDSDIDAARELVSMDRESKKIIELPHVVESDTMDGKINNQYRKISVEDFREGNKYGYILDIAPDSLENNKVSDTILDARTIFVNAVMGFTPHFTLGSKALDEAIDKNTSALKMYGGGDTLQEFKDLCPNPPHYLNHHSR